jgi:hypothetical protein
VKSVWDHLGSIQKYGNTRKSVHTGRALAQETTAKHNLGMTTLMVAMANACSGMSKKALLKVPLAKVNRTIDSIKKYN